MITLGNITEGINKRKIFKQIAELADDTQKEVYLVGGYVRDLLLKRKSKDIDILVVGSGIDFATHLAARLGKRAKVAYFKNFGTAQMKFNGLEIEFVGARKESYRENSRNPIVENGSFDEDIKRRDFTINTMAVSLNGESFGKLIDTFNGFDDLHHKLIRTPLDPDQTYADDPLRMMRAIRFASQLGFQIEEKSLQSIKANADRLKIVSQERVSDELNKIIMSPKPSIGFYLLDSCGLLEPILPELLALKGTETVNNKSHKDNFSHTLQVLDNIAPNTQNLWLRWTALLHDIGKAQTKRFDEQIGWTFYGHELVGSKMVAQIFTRLKLPLGEHLKFVKKMVYLHLRPVALTGKEVTDSAYRRLIVDAGNDIQDLLTLCKADVTSKNAQKVKLYLQRFNDVAIKISEVEEHDRLRNWKNPITGDLIMKTFNLKPSKAVGDIKDMIKEAIMEGTIRNDFDEALEYLYQIGDQLGYQSN